jgi:hypothetical protein
MIAYVIKHKNHYIQEAPSTITPSGEAGLMFAKYFISRQSALIYKLQYMYCQHCRPIPLHEYHIIAVKLEELKEQTDETRD